VRDVQSPNGSCGAYPTEYIPGRGPAFVPSHEICALGPLPGETTKSVDACYGDSGGPLVTATPAGPRLTGTVAWGRYCGLGLNAKSPGVYMRTSAYAPWIQQVIATTPRVSLVDASMTEGNPVNGNKTIKFTVNLDRPVAEVVRVDYTTFNGSAIAGTDYRAETGTIAIPANATTKTLAITVISDRVREGTEQFGVALSNPRIAKMGRGGAIGTILDND
jgi:secreted trypsin-like serine protease